MKVEVDRERQANPRYPARWAERSCGTCGYLSSLDHA